MTSLWAWFGSTVVAVFVATAVLVVDEVWRQHR